MKSYSKLLAGALLLASASTLGAATITLKKTAGAEADGTLVRFSGTGGELTESSGVTIITSAAGIPANDNDITIPTSAAVKAYADSVAGTTISVDPIWTAKGQISAATSAGAAVALGVGTDGQLLTAASGEASGLVWADPAPAGSLTTKGDLEVFTTTQTRLPVGTNGQVLTADSTQASGLAWATPASGGGFDNPATENLDMNGFDILGIDAIDITTLNAGAMQFEGSTVDDFETTLGVVDPTADRTVNLPDASGTVALVAGDIGAATATTAAEDDDSTKVATTAYVQTEIAGLGGGGRVTGRMAVNSKAVAYTIGTDSADELDNGFLAVTAASTISGPANGTMVAGMNWTIKANVAGAVVFDPDAAHTITLDGVVLAAGDSVTISALGDLMVCVATSATTIDITSTDGVDTN